MRFSAFVAVEQFHIARVEKRYDSL
jgi:hypothetical protein